MDEKTTIEALVKEKDVLESVIRELDAKVAAYEELGSIEEMNKLIELTEALCEDYKELKSKVESLGSELEEANAKVQAYESLGTPEEINKALDISYDYIEKVESEKLSRKFGISVDVVTEMLRVYESSSKVEEVLGSLLTAKNEQVVGRDLTKKSRSLKSLTYGL